MVCGKLDCESKIGQVQQSQQKSRRSPDSGVVNDLQLSPSDIGSSDQPAGPKLKHETTDSPKRGPGDVSRDSSGLDLTTVQKQSVPAGRSSSQNSQHPQSTQDWIAEVSHELRLPIANIRLLVETLLDGALDDPETARRMLMRSKVEIDRLQHLVVNLLSVETVSNSRDVHCEWVLLEPRARFAFETLNKVATDKAISVGIQIDDDFKVYANPPQLDQVLLNLLENAIKFTPVNGMVTIKSADKISSFSVSDTGIGMSETEIPKIFQRFSELIALNPVAAQGLGSLSSNI